MVLNFLLGNVDWAGGYITGGGAADYLGKTPSAPYPLTTWPNQPDHVPTGVRISREGAFYEKSIAYQAAEKTGHSPFPAPRPWFPFGFGIWPEIFAGIYQMRRKTPAFRRGDIRRSPSGDSWVLTPQHDSYILHI